ncbi:MAG: AAA family ATPase, partial [Planctomycetota bacterium]|nr:AAA family ATPase [Planctomycetota bacterium]
MKPGDLIAARFRVCGPLESTGKPSGFLVTERPRGKRPRWVLKWLPRSTRRSLRDALRPDILEIASLKHDALALPVRFGWDPASERGFLLRAYIEGSDLLRAIQGKGPREILAWMVSAADALRILHRFGIVHRNLKPGNLVVPRSAVFARRARVRRVILCDPAWLREAAPEGALGPTAPPEVEAGDAATVASDLYSLGAIFYLALTGKPPATVESGFPAPLTHWNPQVPVDLERSVMKLLSPDPGRRYHETAALIDDLRRMSGPRAPETPGVPECFVGRQPELRRCLSRLTARDEPAAVAVMGEAGVGKSAFLQRVALEAQLDGQVVLDARCYPQMSSSPGPLGAFVESLLPQGARGRSLKLRYRRCLRALRGTEAESLPERPDPALRKRLIKDVLELLVDMGEDARTLLVVDEAHLADSFTVDLLASLVREIGAASRRELKPARSPPSLIVSLRSESPFRPAARPLLEALGVPGAGHLVQELAGLDPETVDEWLEAAVARPDTSKRISYHGGNPFAIREAVRLGSAGLIAGQVSASDLGAIHSEYVSRLSPRQRRLLEVLAVLGRPASLELLDSCLSPATSKLGDTVNSLEREGLLGEERGLWFFRHGSFRDWLVGTLDDDSSRRLHRRIASLFEEANEGPLDELARHWLQSDQPHRGVRAALEAARQLVRDHEPRHALFFYSRVLELLPVEEAALKTLVAEEAAEAHAGSGDYPRAIHFLEELLDAPGKAGSSGKLHGRIGVFSHRAGDIP